MGFFSNGCKTSVNIIVLLYNRTEIVYKKPALKTLFLLKLKSFVRLKDCKD